MENQDTYTVGTDGLLRKADGSIAYAEMTRLAKLRGPAKSPAELAAEGLALAAQERERVRVLTDNGKNLAPLAAERDADAAAFRKHEEAAGAERVRKEPEAMKTRLEEIRLQQAEAVELETDPVTDEKVTHNELMLRNHQRAMAAIAEKAAQPITMTDDEMTAAFQRKTELRERYENAKAESLRSKDVAAERV